MIRVVHLGLGEIGKGTVHGLLAQKKEVKLAAVVDVHPDLAGKRLKDVMGNRDSVPLTISSSLADALRSAKNGNRFHVATMTPGSRTEQVRETLEQLIAAGVHVVSTCEELSFP